MIIHSFDWRRMGAWAMLQRADLGYLTERMGYDADVRLINVQRIPPRMIRSIVREVVRRRSFICEQWSAIHGEAI